jgi:sulfur carrier protein
MIMRITVNGEPQTLPEPVTVEAIVATTLARSGRERAARGVAVAVNMTVIPRADWESTRVGDGDEIEILTAVQGG